MNSHFMQTDKKNILVVDDQPQNTNLLKLYLERTNDYMVREENDPLAAVAAAEEFLPKLILLDVMMPGMDGGELAGRLQASPRLKGVPIIFLTAAVTRDEVKSHGGRLSGFPFLAKPFVLSEVLAVLKQHLGE
jgi:two-component system OmpR family response regulator